jgi:hypothetical protein
MYNSSMPACHSNSINECCRCYTPVSFLCRILSNWGAFISFLLYVLEYSIGEVVSKLYVLNLCFKTKKKERKNPKLSWCSLADVIDERMTVG